ncbi:MAG: hypothetical protein PSV22_19780 [Pseudolabrys sp.]|nr:hypothetical protein [Pseudolabrys sp.]
MSEQREIDRITIDELRKCAADQSRAINLLQHQLALRDNTNQLIDQMRAVIKEFAGANRQTTLGAEDASILKFDDCLYIVPRELNIRVTRLREDLVVALKRIQRLQRVFVAIESKLAHDCRFTSKQMHTAVMECRVWCDLPEVAQ